MNSITQPLFTVKAKLGQQSLAAEQYCKMTVKNLHHSLIGTGLLVDIKGSHPPLLMSSRNRREKSKALLLYLSTSHHHIKHQEKTLTCVLHARKTCPSQRLRFNSCQIFTEIEIIHWSQVTPFAIWTVTAVKQGYLDKFHPNHSQKPSSLSDRTLTKHVYL